MGMNDFTQQQANTYGYQRDPLTGALSQPGVQNVPLMPPSNPPGTAQTLGNPNAQAMMMAMQNAAQKRKQKQWPETAPVVHPTTGEVVSPDIASARD